MGDNALKKSCWYEFNGEIRCTVVRNDEGFSYIDGTAYEALGRTCYNTKNELLDAMIDRLENLRNE